MEYRTLGRTGLRVSVIGYDTAALAKAWAGPLPKQEAIKLLRKAWELGINFYVTSGVYDEGKVEELLGEALSDVLDEAVIAVKLGLTKRGGSWRFIYEPEFLVQEAERSIERIGKEPIDLVLLHNPPLEALQDPGLYDAIEQLKSEGLAKHVGVSLGPSPDVLAEAREALKRSKIVEAVEFIYNMLEQEPGRTIASEANAKGVGIIVRAPFAGGVLDESLPEAEASRREELEEPVWGGKRRRGWYKWAYAVYKFMKSMLLEEVAELLQEVTPVELAIRFILSSIPVHSIAVPVRSEKKLEECVRAVEKPLLPAEVVKRIQRVYAERVSAAPVAQSTLQLAARLSQ